MGEKENIYEINASFKGLDVVSQNGDGCLPLAVGHRAVLPSIGRMHHLCTA
jgi:hypothetical protein